MPQPSFSIAGRALGREARPYIIAEMSANHNGKLENAFRLIEEAKKAGADAVKIQTYRADTITLDSNREEFQIRGGLWDGWNLYKLYEWAQTPWEWHEPLFAVDLLEKLGAPAYKIASFEIVDLPLIKYVAGKGKPMILSTGMASAGEIEEAVAAAREGGCRDIAVLHCVSGYPTPAKECNLRTIPDMIERFGLVTGLSDHTLDNAAAVASVALGAALIEKHFTLDRNGGGPDDSFSLEPAELAALVQGTGTAWEALGKVDYALKVSEQGSIKHRRSLYFVKDLKAGETISPDAVRSVRPGLGAPPKLLPKIIGKRVKKGVEKNTPVSMDVIE
jgi:pseudaminic acid synthase